MKISFQDDIVYQKLLDAGSLTDGHVEEFQDRQQQVRQLEHACARTGAQFEELFSLDVVLGVRRFYFSRDENERAFHNLAIHQGYLC